MKNIEMLSAPDLVQMGFSRSMAYQLFNTEGFPTVKIGKRMFVRSDRLMEWLENHEGTAETAV